MRVVKGMPSQRAYRYFFFGAVDCETRGLDGELLFITCAHEAWPGQVRSYRSFSAFLSDIFSLDVKFLRKTIWFSHNAEFDWRYMVPALEPYSDRFSFRLEEATQGRYYELAVLEKDPLPGTNPTIITRFRDSHRIYTGSLREFALAFAPELPKGKIDFEHETFSPDNADHVAYAERDVLCLVEALRNYDAFIYSHYGVHLKATAASTAYQAWLRTIDPEIIHNRQGAAAEQFFRKAYVGGMVQCNALASQSYVNVSCYDINSSYPASMRRGVPVGKCKNTFRYKPGFPGFYEVEFYVGSHYQMPVIAHKGENGELCWPTNEGNAYIRTYCTSIEIEYARTIGYQFNIRHGYYWDDIGDVFSAYIKKCEDLRVRYKGEPTEFVIKLMQNSLYGRFAMREEGKETIVRFDYENHPGNGWIMSIDPDTGEPIPYLWEKETERSAEYMLPHWSAWITAHSRILLDKGCRAIGISRCLYRDTDSLFALGSDFRDLDVGTSYGQFKLEKQCMEFRVHAPKYYTWRDLDGNLHATCKGIPLKAHTPKRLQQLHDNDPDFMIDYLSVTRLKTYLATNKLAVERIRRQTAADKVYGHIIENGKFKPKRIA